MACICGKIIFIPKSHRDRETIKATNGIYVLRYYGVVIFEDYSRVSVGYKTRKGAVEKLSPISAEMRRLLNDKSEIDRVLEGGAERARAIAAPILKHTYEIVGLK